MVSEHDLADCTLRYATSLMTLVSKGPVVVVASPATAQDGQYQAVVSGLGQVEMDRQMVDRLLDGGAFQVAPFSDNRFT
jgi:hypothetical protein